MGCEVVAVVVKSPLLKLRQRGYRKNEVVLGLVDVRDDRARPDDGDARELWEEKSRSVEEEGKDGENDRYRPSLLAARTGAGAGTYCDAATTMSKSCSRRIS